MWEMKVMPYATYPGTKLVEVATMFTKYTADNPFPDSVNLTDGYAVAGGDGIEVWLYHDTDDARSKRVSTTSPRAFFIT